MRGPEDDTLSCGDIIAMPLFGTICSAPTILGRFYASGRSYSYVPEDHRVGGPKVLVLDSAASRVILSKYPTVLNSETRLNKILCSGNSVCGVDVVNHNLHTMLSALVQIYPFSQAPNASFCGSEILQSLWRERLVEICQTLCRLEI